MFLFRMFILVSFLLFCKFEESPLFGLSLFLIKKYTMNTFKVRYQGNLRTTATHLDSGSRITTDAPKDNHGLGEAFSPTDMLCSALASCILTIMAIAVEKKDIDIKDTIAIVKKTMVDNPRRIAKIEIEFTFPKEYDAKTKTILERAAYNCPVHHSISENVEKNIYFKYLDS